MVQQIVWDKVGEREFETGVDHTVLYVPDNTGAYLSGVAWNGITTITESPSGAESNKQYADNIVYANLTSAEEFTATLEAFMWPTEFGQFDGLASPEKGVYVGQQGRKTFGLSYRTKVGNDLDEEAGYKLHLVYGCKAAPSEKAYGTVNDSPELAAFSWELSTTPVAWAGGKPTATLTIDSTEVDAAALAELEAILYGTAADATAQPPVEAVAPRLPLPDEVIALFAVA